MIIDQKVHNALLQEGVDTFKARLIARRIHEVDKALKVAFLSFKELTSPFLIDEMDKAISRLIVALAKKEIIGIETDYDCDGQTAHAILLRALTKVFNHPIQNIRSYIGDRLKDGYGLSKNLVEQIKKDGVSLIITADNGSSDEDSILQLTRFGIDTIVTDHHAVSIRPPSAYAFINPTTSDNFSDPNIAGCMVAWLLMAALQKHFKNNRLTLGAEQITDLLDYVAVGTAADCVSLGQSINNRIVIKYGLKIMNQLKRPAWEIFLKESRQKKKLDTETIRFLIAPFINSASRVGETFDGLKLLLAENMHEGESYFANLKSSNESRKIIQQHLFLEAKEIASLQDSNNVICVYLKNGHIGVSGIIASKLAYLFGKPVAVLAPSYLSHILVGSLRSVDQIDIKSILDFINKIRPDILIRYGGHKKAAGLSINKSSLNDFQSLFQEAASHCLDLKETLSIEDRWKIDHDGSIPDRDTKSIMETIESLAPYGEGFEEPTFYDQAIILHIKYSVDRFHVFFKLQIKQSLFRATLFYFKEQNYTPNFRLLDKILITYKLVSDAFFGGESLIIKRLLKHEK